MKNENIYQVTDELLNACGGSKYLQIGDDTGALVHSLLSFGLDAYGLTSNQAAERRNNVAMPGRFTTSAYSRLPYEDNSFDTVILTYCLEELTNEQLSSAIDEIYRITRRALYLRIRVRARESESLHTIQDRKAWEMLFFDKGFRKHPSYYLINGYESLGRDGDEITILLEKIPADALKRYPLEALKEERDLHMDMTREAGERSDAHIARYQWAATFVRPGDTVLDAACGLGYGSYLIQCGTTASQTIGIDGSEYAIDYASHNFSHSVKNLSFRTGMLPEALDSIPDHSVDVVISFETLEHVPDPEGLLAAFHRVLTPAGRIIVSVPNDWSDETGEDPNPFHLHIYDLNKLRDQIKIKFDLEQVVVQSATQYKNGPGSKQWLPAKRELYNVATDTNASSAPPAEWWLAVGMRPVREGESIPYHESQFKTFEDSEWNVTNFNRDYKNPWLIRGLVDIGHRLKEPSLLKALAEKVYQENKDNSADRGAALCVLGYQLLSATQSISASDINEFSVKVNEYIDSDPVTPHAFRWKVSLFFVTGKLWLQAGVKNKAKEAFLKCVTLDPLQFSPLLANRTVEAFLLLGVMTLIDGDKLQTCDYWRKGIYLAKKAVTADWTTSIGNIDSPVEFGLPELGSILDYASLCAYGLVNIDMFEDKPWWWLQLRRSRNAQASMLERKLSTLHILGEEINKLNEILVAKDNAIKDMTYQNQSNTKNLKGNATSQLNNALHEKETALINLANEIEVKSRFLDEYERKCELKDSVIKDLNSNINVKDDFIIKLNDSIKELNHKVESKDQIIPQISSSLDEKNRLIESLEQELQRKDALISELSDNILNLNGQLNSRLIRLKNVAAQPWSIRKTMHLSYLLASLATPLPIRRSLAPVVSKLRAKYSRRPVVLDLVTKSDEETGYKVQVPQVRSDAPKVVHVIANFMTGGSSRLVVDLIEYLGSEYQQAIITSFIPDPPAYLGIDIEECRFPVDSAPFIQYFKRQSPDFIHVHYWGDVDEPWYAKAIEAAKVLNIPVIENINTPIAPHLSDAVKRYVYVSDYVRQVFGQKNNTHVTIYPGSDFSRFIRDDRDAVPKDCIGMVYRLEGDKLNINAIEPFIKTVQKRPQTKVLIVGGGTLLEPFKLAVKEAGLEDSFEFAGYVKYDDLPGYYRRMSVFVAPVWKESFGQVSPFAMNMRVPVIGYNVGAISEIVNSDVMLAPAGDADALSDIAITLLDDDKLRNKLGKEHQIRAKENFSIQAMIDAYHHLYAEVTSDKVK